MNKKHAQEIVMMHEIDSAVELEGNEIKQNNPELYESYIALLSLADMLPTSPFDWEHESKE